MGNSIANFTTRLNAYRRAKEEFEHRSNELLDHAIEDLQPLIGKAVEIKVKNKTYTGTVHELSGPPRKEYIVLSPCTTGTVSIHILSISGLKEI